ncbi:MAG: endonuclease/exonuclease/phosphatase family protein [Anaerolineae bacterium]|nr:endonuclease/exonuclease/phosphatase family protein [Anaerolineae bacterium]
MKFLTYNIHRWVGGDGRIDVERLATVLRESKADVLALQEVVHPLPDDQTPLVELANWLGMEWVFGPSDESVSCSQGPCRLGNAILSSYPIVSWSNHPLPGLKRFTRRALLSARLRVGENLTMTVHATHLDHVWEPVRLAQLATLLPLMARRHQEPHWLLGDFNAPSLSGPLTQAIALPVIRRLRAAGYVDAFATVGRGRAATCPARAPFLRLDYLFVARRWAGRLRSCQALDGDLAGWASDHRPVVASWDWPA